MKLRVMTYNICSGRNLLREHDIRFAASVINKLQPDICALNEVRSHTSDAPYDQANELGRLCGYYPVFGKSISVNGGAYGNALLARLPLDDAQVIHIPDVFAPGDRRAEHRTILKCDLRANGRPLTVMVSHFGLSQGEQESAVSTAVNELGKVQGDALFMGDFNMRPDDPTLAPLFHAMMDSACGAESPRTFPSGEPAMKIDYIFHSAGIRAFSPTAPNTQMSDHRPLVCDVDIHATISADNLTIE